MHPFHIGRHTLRLVAVAGALCSLTSLGLCDEVVMRDGTIHTGKVVSRSRRTVQIDTEIHGISTRLELDRRLIKSIVIGEDTGADADTDADTDAESGTPGAAPSIPAVPTLSEPVEKQDQVMKRDGYNLILEVPLKGTFGQDIYPLGVADSLEWAVDHGVTDVVFRINSGGGEVWCAMDMVEIMNQYRGKVKMHMLIESSISASIWPSFTCDTITMCPGSDFGGAVVYTHAQTGSAEVDLKMNSIWAAKLESAADANGYSGYLVRAMMLSSAAVYAYKGEDGSWEFSDNLEGLPANYEVIDGPDTVLTLTAKQAIKYGLVDAMKEGNTLDEFAKIHGIEKWDNAGDIGYELVEKDVEKSKRLRDRLQATIASFNTEVAIIGDRKYVSGVGSSLQTMRRHLGTFKRLMRDADEMHMPSIIDSLGEKIDVTYWENEIETRMAELRRILRGP